MRRLLQIIVLAIIATSYASAQQPAPADQVRALLIQGLPLEEYYTSQRVGEAIEKTIEEREDQTYLLLSVLQEAVKRQPFKGKAIHRVGGRSILVHVKTTYDEKEDTYRVQAIIDDDGMRDYHDINLSPSSIRRQLDYAQVNPNQKQQHL